METRSILSRIASGCAAFRSARAAHRAQKASSWGYLRLHATNEVALARLKTYQSSFWHGTSWSRIKAQFEQRGGFEERDTPLYLAQDRLLALNYAHQALADAEDFPALCEVDVDLKDLMPHAKLSCWYGLPETDLEGHSTFTILRAYGSDVDLSSLPGRLARIKEKLIYRCWRGAEGCISFIR